MFILQTQHLSADWRSIQLSEQRIICRSRNYMQIKIQSADQKSIPSSARTISKSKNYQQIEESSGDWRIICRLKSCTLKYWICRSKQDVLIQELFHQQIKELSADWWSIPSVDRRTVCRLKNYHLQVELQSADGRIFCKSRIICTVKY